MTTENRSLYNHPYRIKVRGAIDEEFMRTYCPPGFVLHQEGTDTILANLGIDQSGLLGLIRQFHNLGLTILSIERYPESKEMK